MNKEDNTCLIEYKYRENCFIFWCDLFHKKYHKYKDLSNCVREHYCTKCLVYYLSPDLKNLLK